MADEAGKNILRILQELDEIRRNPVRDNHEYRNKVQELIYWRRIKNRQGSMKKKKQRDEPWE